MNSEPGATLRRLLPPDRPFGPTKSEDFREVIDEPSAARILYDNHNALHRRISQENPNCLIGRKGAGKTAFLLSMSLRDGTEPVVLRQSQIFVNMQNFIDFARTRHSKFLGDQVGDLWQIVILHVAAQAAVSRSNDSTNDQARNLVWRYLDKFVQVWSPSPHSDPTNVPADELAEYVVQSFIETVRKLTAATITHLKAELTFEGVSYPELAEAVDALVGATDRGPIHVVIDSLEDIDKRISDLSDSIEGILTLLSSSRLQERTVRLFVCLPAELLETFLEISPNTGKTMERSLFLQWRTQDLLILAASRLSHHLGAYPERDPGGLRAELERGIAASNPTAIKRALLQCLPNEVLNAQGYSEPTLAYIIRHTQLLPRHLLQYMNDIWKRAELTGSQVSISPTDVTEGVAEGEQRIFYDALKAYRGRWPQVQEICQRLIPRLTVEMPVKDILDRIKEAGVEGHTGGDERDVLQVLVDVGALGRREAQGEKYTSAIFSFSRVKVLYLHEDDVGCIHPLYSKQYETRTIRDSELARTRAIYPFGLDIELASTVDEGRAQ